MADLSNGRVCQISTGYGPICGKTAAYVRPECSMGCCPAFFLCADHALGTYMTYVSIDDYAIKLAEEQLGGGKV